MSDIDDYNSVLESESRQVAETIRAMIGKTIPEAEGKVWHGHPVWFIAGNPVVGFSLKKSGIELLFWSGQSFPTVGLTPVGKYQAAGLQGLTNNNLGTLPIVQWLRESEQIQWDYKNLPKNRTLVKLTEF
ncbi:MAG: hypothetical protein RIS31_134 [Actinomycetota bacterium]|jgi:hypothetical protein